MIPVLSRSANRRRKAVSSAPSSLLTGLVSYWKLNEASGNAIDAHGGNTLTNNNSVGSAAGIIGNARSFVAASSQYFSIASNADLSIANATVSYEFWIWAQISTTSGTKQPITKRTAANTGSGLEYMLRIDGATPVAYWGLSGVPTFGSVSSGVTMSINTWYLLTFGFDASTGKFFITANAGSPVLSAVQTLQTLAGTNAFQIGGTNSEYHSGLLDEAGFRKGSILTGAERTALYNGGSGLTYPF